MVSNGAIDKKDPPFRLVVGHMQSGNGQNGSHDIVAAHADPDDGILPEIAHGSVVRHRCVCKCAKIVQQFQVVQIEVLGSSSISGRNHI